MSIVIGNIISFMASLIQLYAGYQKEKKKILIYNTIQTAMSALSNILNNGITGAIINAVNVIRNILCYKEKFEVTSKIIITIIITILTIAFNNKAIVGLLPLIASVAYIWLMTVKDVTKFKMLSMFSNLMWLIYEIYINLYAAAVFDVLSIIINFIAIVQIYIERKKQKRLL